MNKAEDKVTRQELEDEIRWLSERLVDMGWGGTRIEHLRSPQTSFKPKSSIDKLIYQASATDNSNDAMRFSQSALNVANALVTKKHFEDTKKQTTGTE